MDAKNRSVLVVFVCCSIFWFIGCTDNEYIDTILGLTVQQLDGD